jgi:metal-responsive CopG/Arc/MetJ family transcriptional regulator|tara:strand:+ start:208 stop:411 length:204 start_codon:yes stop_codon:yes gene_type:complete
MDSVKKDTALKKISINLPIEILEEIDLIRKQNMSPRSSWFLNAAKNELKKLREEKSKNLLEKLKETK